MNFVIKNTLINIKSSDSFCFCFVFNLKKTVRLVLSKFSVGYLVTIPPIIVFHRVGSK